MKTVNLNVEKRWYQMPMSLVFDNRLNEGEKIMLFAMLNRSSQFNCSSNTSFYCKESWFSEKLGCTSRTIINRLNTLKKIGYITVKKVKEGSYYVNHYYINWDYINEFNNTFDINAVNSSDCGCEETPEKPAVREDNIQAQEVIESPVEEEKPETISEPTVEPTGININGISLPEDNEFSTLLERAAGKEGNYFYFSWQTYANDNYGISFAYDLICHCHLIKQEQREDIEDYFVKFIYPQIKEKYAAVTKKFAI